MTPTFFVRYLALCAAALGIAACGFALKGAAKPLPFTQVQLHLQSDSTLGPQVQRGLLARGVSVSTDATAALPRIGLSQEKRERSVLATNVNGKVREFQLKHSVTVQVWDAQGQEWLPAVNFSHSRDLGYDENKALAKEVEEAVLYKALQAELLSTVMRRLEALRTVATPAAPAVAK